MTVNATGMSDRNGHRGWVDLIKWCGYTYDKDLWMAIRLDTKSALESVRRAGVVVELIVRKAVIMVCF